MMDIVGELHNIDPIVIIGFAVCIALIGAIIMKIRKGRVPKNPQTVYGCSECGEYFTSFHVLQIHCENVHDIILSDSEADTLTYGVTMAKFEEMLDQESELQEQVKRVQANKDDQTNAKLSQDPSKDPEDLIETADLSEPDVVYKKLVELLESPTTSKPLPGLFKIDIDGSEIKLIVALKLQNTASNMTAISEFNTSIS